MANLTLAVGGLWGQIINWFQSFIPSFGLTIIVFTVALKLILSPLEVYQKISAKKNSEIQARIQPKLNKLQKQYANNKEMLNQKTMELYKKENYNVVGSCLGVLINLVVTLVVFITLFSSLNAISQYNIKTEYEILTQTYEESFVLSAKDNSYSIVVSEDETLKSLMAKIKTLSEEDQTAFENSLKEQAKADTVNKYSEIKEGFLWIKNIYRPDTYASVFPDAKDYMNISNTSFKNVSAENPYIDIYGNRFETEDSAKEGFTLVFNDVTGDINKEYSGWNGYLILVILSAVITVLSQILSAKTTKPAKQYDKNGEEINVPNPTGKLMMFLLPALMVIFTLQYSAAFALYIVVNSLMSVIISFVTTLIMNAVEKKKANISKEV